MITRKCQTCGKAWSDPYARRVVFDCPTCTAKKSDSRLRHAEQQRTDNVIDTSGSVFTSDPLPTFSSSSSSDSGSFSSGGGGDFSGGGASDSY